MIIYEKMVRICIMPKTHIHKKPITEWHREEYEEFPLNEMREGYSDRVQDLRVEYKYVKIGDIKWH